MPNHKTPLAVAEATGRTQHDPGRYKNRNEPTTNRELGQPPAYFDHEHVKVWYEMADAMFWLQYSDKFLVEEAVKMIVLSRNDKLPSTMRTQLMNSLKVMGGTPTTRQDVYIPPEDDKDDLLD